MGTLQTRHPGRADGAQRRLCLYRSWRTTWMMDRVLTQAVRQRRSLCACRGTNYASNPAKRPGIFVAPDYPIYQLSSSRNGGPLETGPSGRCWFLTIRTGDHPTVFWIMNAWNDFENNMAAGAGTCGVCYWMLPGINSGGSRMMNWTSYASEQQLPDSTTAVPRRCRSLLATVAFRRQPQPPRYGRHPKDKREDAPHHPMLAVADHPRGHAVRLRRGAPGSAVAERRRRLVIAQ